MQSDLLIQLLQALTWSGPPSPLGRREVSRLEIADYNIINSTYCMPKKALTHFLKEVPRLILYSTALTLGNESLMFS